MKRKRPEDYETLVKTILLLLMFVTVCFIARGGRRIAASVSSDEVQAVKERPCVVIDAGHGGSR